MTINHFQQFSQQLFQQLLYTFWGPYTHQEQNELTMDIFLSLGTSTKIIF